MSVVFFLYHLTADGYTDKNAKLGNSYEGKFLDNSIKDESGETFSISDFKEKVVIVMFFTTWCPNCQNVLRDLESLVEKFENSENIKIITLNIGDESLNSVKIYYKSNNIQLLEAYHSVPLKVMNEIIGVPACFVFDKEGAIVWKHVGGINYNSEEFIKFIEKLAK